MITAIICFFCISFLSAQASKIEANFAEIISNASVGNTLTANNVISEDATIEELIVRDIFTSSSLLLSARMNGILQLKAMDWDSGDPAFGGDDGIIISDPDLTDSDIIVAAGDNIRMDIDWDGGSAGEFEVFSNTTEILNLKENGEFEIYNGTNRILWLTSTGNLFIDGDLNPPSDVRKKKNIHLIEYNDVLQKLKSVPLYEWEYLNQDVKHIGPMAQDFYKAFGLGHGETSISTVDADGVALSSIIALSQENDQLKAALAQQKQLIDSLLQRVSLLEKKD